MSAANPIVITQFDHDRLSRLLERLRREGNLALAGASDHLEEELDRATVVQSGVVPPTVVTMNSSVEAVDLDTSEVMQVAVVFPGEAAPKQGKVSVLAPVGLALLGARVGDEITWPMPGRDRRLRVARILYQPEAAGRFDL